MISSQTINEQAERHWDKLHTNQKFRPRYPNEDVVRFLAAFASTRDVSKMRALDIGVGGGRHTKLLCEFGFQTTGVDISAEGLKHADEWLKSEGAKATMVHAPMTELPFEDNTFDVVVAYGVLYYSDEAGVKRAVSEVHRVLKPGGVAFAFTHTTNDYRFGKGERIEPRTFKMTIEDTNELGTVQHFLGEEDVPVMFGAFSKVEFERLEWTVDNRRRQYSHWHIRLQK
jgi:ubiquinone/menaquinone biosynthesis C-methylase UbiE